MTLSTTSFWVSPNSPACTRSTSNRKAGIIHVLRDVDLADARSRRIRARQVLRNVVDLLQIRDCSPARRWARAFPCSGSRPPSSRCEKNVRTSGKLLSPSLPHPVHVIEAAAAVCRRSSATWTVAVYGPALVV